MSQTEYLIIAIVILVILAVTFIVSFVLYQRTPKPKGCEDLKPSDEKCAGCTNDACAFYKEKDSVELIEKKEEK